MENPLKREFDWYIAHQDEIVTQYDGRYVVVRDCKVIGAYNDQSSAIAETTKTYPLGTFLVQKVERGSSAYSQTFHTRVAPVG